MTTLRRPIGSIVPRMKVEVFNTLYLPADAIQTDVDVNYDADRCGWLSLPDWVCEYNGFSLDAPIGKKWKGELHIPTELEYMMDAGIVRKCDDASLLSTVSTTVTNQIVNPCRLLVMVDSAGITTPVLTGTITISGTDETDAIISDTLQLNGIDDTLITPKTYKTYTSIETDGAIDATISVWGDIGLHLGVRESRIVIDSNEDDIYGRVFGGYTSVKRRKLDLALPTTILALDGYDLFLMQNEYIAGYRATHRCLHYSKTGESGACSEAAALSPAALAIWQKNGEQGCWEGDSDTMHPDGTHTNCFYCTDYDAGTEVLPYDTWNYYEGYCTTGEPKKEPYPPSIFKMMVAMRNMLRSLETDKVTPLTWEVKLEDYGTAMLAEDIFTANVKSTCRATGESIAQISTSYVNNNEFVFWCDPMKQVRLTELDLDNAGHTNLVIAEEDIIGTPIIKYGKVVNDVNGWVTTASGTPSQVYCRMTAAETGFTDFDLSQELFGLSSEEHDLKHLNSMAPLIDHFDFETYAKNYLKIHAFPKVTQTIEIGTFVPDENYWSDMIAPPLMDYTDTANKFIMLQGTKVSCIDYTQPSHPTSAFIIENIRYKMNDPGELRTYITMSRLTTAGEYK